MEGGRFLGAGSFGCVFTPPLLCQGDKKQRHGKVGKITVDILAQQEIRVANRIRRIPMAKHYFLLPEPESCQPAPEEEQIEPGLEECKKQMSDDPSLPLRMEYYDQIFEPFGGSHNFFYFMDSKKVFQKQFSFVRTMRHLLEAGSVLLLAGVCHFDIHPGNIIIDNQNHFHILDYGNSFIASELNETSLEMRWVRIRFGFEADAHHPGVVNASTPEFTVMNAIEENKFSVDHAVKLTVYGKPVFKDMEKYLGISLQESKDDLMSFFHTSNTARQRQFVKLWKMYWPGFDSWSIANILFTMLKELMFHPPFVQGEYKSKEASIKATLRGMLDPNPRHRLDCIEALALFDPGNPWLNRFGQKWLETRKQQRSKK